MYGDITAAGSDVLSIAVDLQGPDLPRPFHVYSMRQAIDETDRRRVKQEAHNKAHNITPKSIKKMVVDIMEGRHDDAAANKAAEEGAVYQAMTPAQAAAEIATLEEQMYTHAENLEFEEAAAVRDKIGTVKRHVLQK